MTTKRHKPFVPTTLGERVAHARRLLGVYEGRDILPPDLAERVGVTVNAVYAWEKGTEPGKANRQLLADELRVSLEWLLHGSGNATNVLARVAKRERNPAREPGADTKAKGNRAT